MPWRLSLPLALVFVLIFGVSSVAAKGPPIHEFYTPPDLEFAPGEVCAFGVTGEVLHGRGHDKITEFEDGTLQIRTTGVLVARITNVSTGESVVRNFSGPVDFVMHPDGTATSWNRGHTLAFLLSFEPGGPALWHHSGTIRWAVDEQGLFSVVSETGIREDLCATLS
jgi:hypothetical protein